MQNHVKAHAEIPMISAARWEETVVVARWGSGSDTAFVDCGVVVVTVVVIVPVYVVVVVVRVVVVVDVVFVVVVTDVVVTVVDVVVVVVGCHCDTSARHELVSKNGFKS